MAAITGGRMEVIVRRPSLTGPDYLRLAILVVVSAAVHLWLVAHTAVPARDAIGFARYALCLQSPHQTSLGHEFHRTPIDVIREQQHPPGYPLAIWAAAKFVRHTTTLPLPESTLLAAQLVSALAAVLLVVPTYLLGRMLFGRTVGFAAALLFQVLPVPARITSDGLSEGLYLLATATAVVLGVRAARRPGVGGFLLCGLACGASYLVRPEGLLVAGAVGLVAGWLGLVRVWPRDVALGRLTALAVGVALVAGPYAVLIGNLTNKPTAKEMVPSIQGPRERIIGARVGPAAPVGGPVFADYWTLPPDAGPGYAVGRAVVGLAKETGKGLHYFGAALAVCGLFAYRRRLAVDPGLWVLLAAAGLNAALLMHLGSTGYFVNGKRTFYVSERHVVLLVLVGCAFSAAALGPVAAALSHVPKLGRLWAGRLAPAGLLLAVVASALPSTLKPLHEQREGHKHAGRWLKENAGEGDCVIDPFDWAQWYAGRTLHFIPTDPPGAEVLYAVLDGKNHSEDHERLPRMKDARNVAADGRSAIVYQWPEDGPRDSAKVLVYKLVRPKGE
jgi:hypothetical protein